MFAQTLRQIFATIATVIVAILCLKNSMAPIFILAVWAACSFLTAVSACIHEDDDTIAEHFGFDYRNKYIVWIIWLLIALGPVTLLVIAIQNILFNVIPFVWDWLAVKPVKCLNKLFVG
jgi:hypothetical protein